MFIYKVTNNITGKVYIGKKEILDDWNSYYGSGKIIKRSLKKYGKENFTKEIIEECKTKQELNKRERYWIQKLNTLYPNGYNIMYGGNGGDILTHHPNKIQIGKKISKSHIGKLNHMFGKKHTKEKPIKKIHNHKLSNSELKFCLKCKESKLSIDFGRDNRQTDNKAIYCRECKNKVSIPPLTKKEIKDKRRRVGKSFMEKRDYLTYGITIEKYDEMFELQKGKCAICEEIQITGKVLAIDHCHTTGKVRGLLCQTCNTGIAMFKDNIKILKMAIKYLELYSI